MIAKQFIKTSETLRSLLEKHFEEGVKELLLLEEETANIFNKDINETNLRQAYEQVRNTLLAFSIDAPYRSPIVVRGNPHDISLLDTALINLKYCGEKRPSDFKWGVDDLKEKDPDSIYEQIYSMGCSVYFYVS